jgi:hypothetical protein
MEVTMSNCSSVILFVATGMPFLLFVAVETGICVPLSSKLTTTSAAIPALRPCLPSRYLATDIQGYSIHQIN